MDGTETGWSRPAEPAPRWRALLDRALLGSRTGEQPMVAAGGDAGSDAGDVRQGDARVGVPGRPGDTYPGSTEPLPSRPVPLERRPRHPLDQRDHPREVRPGELGPDQRAEPRPVPPVERRPINPLDRRAGRDLSAAFTDARPPLERRPVNPLEPRRQPSPSEGPGRGDAAEGQHSFFNPATRTVPPPIARITRDNGYPPARAAASVGSAALLPPPAPPAVPPAPAAPPPAPAAPPSSAPPAVPAAPPAVPAAPPAVPAAPPPAPAAPPPAPAAPPPAPPSSAGVPAAPPAGPGPSAEIPARVEWRQARPDDGLERAIAVLRRKLGGPKVVAFANPKGGVHKTTATVLAAATIGSVRGRGVLAWDDNELRGTLGLRAGSARHARTIRHLVTDLMQIEDLHGDDLIHRLDDYLRHASDGSYDVLAGEENPRFAQRLDQPTVRRVMDLLRRTHDVICVDTGNNVESVNWQTVMQAADQLVITTVPREDAAFTADWMLDLLNDIGMEELAAGAVTLISCPTPGTPPLLDDFSKHFATRTRAVAVVPYDPALEVGSSIEYNLLQPQTRQAWLRAAAVMIEPFTH